MKKGTRKRSRALSCKARTSGLLAASVTAVTDNADFSTDTVNMQELGSRFCCIDGGPRLRRYGGVTRDRWIHFIRALIDRA